MDACAKCHRTMAGIRRDLTVDTMRGAAPLCAIPGCPIVARLSGFASLAAIRGKEVEGPAPGLFVGRHGYPLVGVGPLVPPAEAFHPLLATEPSAWVDEDIATLVGLRSRLLRSRAPVHVVDRAGGERVLEAARAAAMSTRPVETTLRLSKEPSLASPRLDAFAPPMGPGVEIERASVLGNPSVPRRVDALVADRNAPAETAVAELASAGVSPYQIERLLAVGLLGTEERRRLVPTRWAITATDDMLSRQALEEVRALPELGEIRLHHGERFGNRFWVALLPRAWSFEMVEAWRVGEGWQTAADREGPRGRTAYVEEVAGAYYAARLAAAEHLRGIRRQAAVLVAREITEDYWAPLGVWVIRETVRLALAARPLVFGELPALAAHLARQGGFRRFGAESRLLHEASVQRRLGDFA